LTTQAKGVISRHEIEKAAAEFPKKKIGVFGDHCLDRYMVGRMEAISRDAPVPIVRLYEDRYSPGGGGNVAMNAAALGAQVFALGAVGDDLTAEILRRCYRAAGISDDFLITCPGRSTIAFNKLYATASHGRPQQVARFDRENTIPLPDDAEDKVIEAMERLAPELDAVLICDYEEVPGTAGASPRALRRLLDLARQHGIVLAADSRMRIGALGPVDIAKPNDLEAAAAAGMADFGHRGDIPENVVLEAGRRLLDQAGIRHVVLTRGEHGMLVFERGGRVTAVPTIPPQGQIDVTGAGDTALAALALGFAAGLPIARCAGLANLAAHVTIHKLNTTGTATPQELLDAYDRTASLW